MRRLAMIAAVLAARMALAQDTVVRIDTQYPERELTPLTFLEGMTPRLVAEVRQAGVLNTNIAGHSAV